MNKPLEIYKKIKQDDPIVPLAQATERKGEWTEAYPLGFKPLDNALKVKNEISGGIRVGDLVVLTGLSGSGKTTLMQNISVNLSKLNFASIWFSYEVLIDNLYAKFKEMGIKEDNFYLYTPKRNTTGNLSWIKEKIKEGIEKYHTRFVFIDHIDFLTPTKVNSTDQRRMILRDICQELKTMAIDLQLIIFLVSHVKKVQGREVEMQDIAESSGIYQLADLVISTTRIYKKENINGVIIEQVQPVSRINILKNRLTGEMPFMNFTLQDNIIRECINIPEN